MKLYSYFVYAGNHSRQNLLTGLVPSVYAFQCLTGKVDNIFCNLATQPQMFVSSLLD